MSETAKRNLILILGVLSASTSCLFTRWSTCPAVVLALYRMLLSVALMVPFMLLRERRALLQVGRRELLLCLLAGVFLGVHFTCYFAAVNHTSVAAAQTLTNLEVFFVALVSFLLWRERITAPGWFAIAVIFAGGVVIAMSDAGGGSLAGDLLAVGAGLSMACYTLIGRRNRRHLSTSVYTFLVYSASAVTLLLMVGLSGAGFGGYGAVNWLCALAMAVLCTIGGHTVFSWSLRYFPAAHVSTIKLLDPLFSTLLGLLFLGELPTFVTLLGCVVLIGGTALYIHSGN